MPDGNPDILAKKQCHLAGWGSGRGWWEPGWWPVQNPDSIMVTKKHNQSMSSAVGRAFPDYLVHVFEPQSRLSISFSSAMDLMELKADPSLLNHSTL